ncbi:MAG: hypothetical protein GEU78_13165 [Actinobacteria bacterium]|nr:hypothetical protein [Actinomycetota bacterium]
MNAPDEGDVGPMPLQRRVVYIIIDGMSTEAFEQATSSGRAPALAFIKERGHYVRDSVAVFPTITPAATSSLVTGEVPARHGIPGMCWYDRQAARYVNYGQSPRAALIQGVKQVVRDYMHNLNQEHLSKDVSTIHESLDRLGLTTASINFMVFRGPHKQELRPGLFKRMLFRKPLPDYVYGPKEHYFADVLEGSADGVCRSMLSKRGLEERMKATDAWAACVTRDLLERRAADMILFYLHENDHMSHRNGPASQTENIIAEDEHVAYVLDAFDSWEQACDEVGFVITADHAQSPVSDEEEHILEPAEMLDDFKLLRPKRGKERMDGRDLAAAGNGRVGFFYLNQDRAKKLHRPVTDTLLSCDGIDQVMWRERDGYVVASDRGRVWFNQANYEGLVDERGNKWRYEGDLAAIDGIVEENQIRTPEYPLAMWRIKSALDLDRIGDVVATTSLTYELRDLGGADHKGGGDHASLHVQDSMVPFVSTLDEPPFHPSTVDVAPHIVKHFERVRT